MELVIENHEKIAAHFAKEWTLRSESALIVPKGPGCFVWYSGKDGLNGSGLFCTRGMLKKHSDVEMAMDLEKMIDEADHQNQLVVALIFSNQAIGMCIAKVY